MDHRGRGASGDTGPPVRPLLDFAYRLQKRLWRLLKPRTRGVKVMLFNAAGEILLIRNNYGDTRLFVLPGGGIRPWEKPDAAAVREVREELGCDLRDLKLVATYCSTAEGKRDTIFLYRAALGGEPQADNFEVAEARFFASDALPGTISPATLRRIEEMQGRLPATGDW